MGLLAPIISTHGHIARNAVVQRHSSPSLSVGNSVISCVKQISSIDLVNAQTHVSELPLNALNMLFPLKISSTSCQSFISGPEVKTHDEATNVEEEQPGDEKLEQFWHDLPSGLRLEVLMHKAWSGTPRKSTPLVFVHGSYHAAWCWTVHWLPYFASRGYDCYGVSLLGQGGSDAPLESGPAGTIQNHARDVSHFIYRHCQNPPVLIGHSFGGLIVQYYLSQMSLEKTKTGMSLGWGEPYPCLAGAVLACSVPPTGNSAVVKRFLTSKPLASIKVTLSLAAKMFATSVPLCRETFFSPSMADGDVVKYQKLMKESSKAPLFDLQNLNKMLPVPPPVKGAPPVLVVGAENDFILDKQGIEETASFLGTKEVIIPGVAHDMMLDTRWEDSADVLHTWITENIQM